MDMEKVTKEMLALSLHESGRPVDEIARALQRDERWVRDTLEAAGRKEDDFAYRVGLRGERETEVLLTEAYSHLLRLPQYVENHPEYHRQLEDLLDRIARNRGFVRTERGGKHPSFERIHDPDDPVYTDCDERGDAEAQWEAAIWTV